MRVGVYDKLREKEGKLSVAIIPMSHQYSWNSSTTGLVQSSFFWGYALSQLPGGWLAKIFGGRRVLEFGVLIWSFATAFVPLVPGFMPGLDLLKILVGIGGVSPSASTDMIARLLLAPPLIVNYGWGSVFYIFGSLGIAWYSMFQVVKEDKLPFSASDQSLASNKSLTSSLKDLGGSLTDVPWKEFFKSKAVWAMIRTINYITSVKMAGLLFLGNVLKELNKTKVHPKFVHRLLAPTDEFTIKMKCDASWNPSEERYFLANTFWIRKQPTLFKARVGWVKGVYKFLEDATKIDARPHGSHEGEMFAALQGAVLFHRLKLYENYRKLTLQLDNDGVATDIYNSLSGLEVVSKVKSRKEQLLVEGNFKFTPCNWVTGGDEVMGADKIFIDEELLKFTKEMIVTKALKNLDVFPGEGDDSE
ncbi:hypothetical protein OROMI_027884 [Orobanche minor]